MNLSNNLALKILYVLSWLIFIGVSIEAGGIIVNSVIVMTGNLNIAKNFWGHIDLSGLYTYDRVYFVVITFIMSLVAVLKATIFYLLIKLLHDKKLSLAKPFSKEVGSFLFFISYLCLAIGLFSTIGSNYTTRLIEQSVQMPSPDKLKIGGNDVWVFMGVALYVIAQIFKRGIELQSENELTV